MNYLTLSKFILAFGAVLLVIGGIKLVANLPMSAPSQQLSGNSLAAMNTWVGNMGNAMEVQDKNEVRSYKRADAFKVIGAGVVIIFVGIAVMKSAKADRIPRN